MRSKMIQSVILFCNKINILFILFPVLFSYIMHFTQLLSLIVLLQCLNVYAVFLQMHRYKAKVYMSYILSCVDHVLLRGKRNTCGYQIRYL